MRMIKFCLFVSSLTTASSTVFAIDWVRAGGQSCNIVCRDAGKQPVISGTYTRNGNNFYVCAANAGGEGFRAGYNLIPISSNTCTVGFGNQESSQQRYHCLCQ